MAHGGSFRTPSVQADRYGQFYVSWRSANGHSGEQDNDATEFVSKTNHEYDFYPGTQAPVALGTSDFYFAQYGGTSDQTGTFNVTCDPRCATLQYKRHYTYRSYHNFHYTTASGDSYLTINTEPPNTKYFKSGCSRLLEQKITDELTAENLTGYGSVSKKANVGVIASFVDGLTIHLRKTHNGGDTASYTLTFVPDDDLTPPDGMYGQYNVLSAQSGKYYGVKGTLTGGDDIFSFRITIDVYYTYDGGTYTPVVKTGDVEIMLGEGYQDCSAEAYFFIADDCSATSYYVYVLIPGYYNPTCSISNTDASSFLKILSRESEYLPPSFSKSATLSSFGGRRYHVTVRPTSTSASKYTATLNVRGSSLSFGDEDSSDTLTYVGVVDGSTDGDSEESPAGITLTPSIVEGGGTHTYTVSIVNPAYISQSRTYRWVICGYATYVIVDITLEPALVSTSHYGRRQSYMPFFTAKNATILDTQGTEDGISFVPCENWIYMKFDEDNPSSQDVIYAFCSFCDEDGRFISAYWHSTRSTLTRNTTMEDMPGADGKTYTHIVDSGTRLDRLYKGYLTGVKDGLSTNVVRADTGEAVDFVDVSVDEDGVATINVLPHGESDIPDEGVFVLTSRTRVPMFLIKSLRTYYTGNSESRSDTPYVWKSDEEDEESDEESEEDEEE